MFWEEQGPVSQASLLSVIDHWQNQQLSFVKASFLLPVSFHPFLRSSLAKILASDLLRNTFSQGSKSSCWVPTAHLTCPLSRPGRLNSKLVQLLLFFIHKLGNWVRSKSPGGRAEGNGMGTDQWDPHLTSGPKGAYSWTSARSLLAQESVPNSWFH